MALIKMGAAVQDIRGSLNGSTYSRNKGGAYIRTKVSPVQPRTPAQLAVRNTFAVLSKLWSGSLTQDQRNAWAAFAAANPLSNVFGDSIIISGIAAFMQLNAVLGNIGVAPVLDPPVDKSVTPIAAVTGINPDAGTPEFDIDTETQTVVAGTKYYVFATAYLAPGVTPSQSAYRFIGAFATSAATTSFDIGTPYFAKYGAPIVGKNTWVLVAFVNVATGALTTANKFVGTW